MTTWALIVIMYWTHGGGPFAIDGFKTQAACQVEATRLEELLKVDGMLGTRVLAMCLEMKK